MYLWRPDPYDSLTATSLRNMCMEQVSTAQTTSESKIGVRAAKLYKYFDQILHNILI